MVCYMRQSWSGARLDLHRRLQHRPCQHLHLFQGPNDRKSDEKAVAFLAFNQGGCSFAKPCRISTGARVTWASNVRQTTEANTPRAGRWQKT